MVYSGLTLVSRVMGFARDLVVTYYMGASATFVADAYTTAFAFPNLFPPHLRRRAPSAAAFVPAYAKSLEKDGEAVADILAADAMAALLAMTVAITVIAELAMPWIIAAYSPGFAAVPGKVQLTIVLTMITMPYLPCMAIYAHLSGVLNARNRFILSAAAPILLNIWTLVAVVADPYAARRGGGRLDRGDLRRDHPGGAALVGRAQVRRPCRLATAPLHPGDSPVDRPGLAWGLRRQRQPDQRLRLPVPGQPRQRCAHLVGGVRPALSIATGPGRGGHRRGPAAAPVAGGARRRPGRLRVQRWTRP